MHYDHINVPADGVPIAANPDHSLNVPNFQIIPLIEGDSIAPGTKLVGTRGCGEAIIRHTDD